MIFQFYGGYVLIIQGTLHSKKLKNHSEVSV